MGKIEVIAKNKKAYFEYEILDTYNAGIKLSGTEIKAVRDKSVSMADAYCFFQKTELFVKNLHISEYSHGSDNNHNPLSNRKLLLTKRELKKLATKVKERGFTIVPLSMFLSERGFAKLEIAVVKGKKIYDKRKTIKDRDMERDLARYRK